MALNQNQWLNANSNKNTPDPVTLNTNIQMPTATKNFRNLDLNHDKINKTHLKYWNNAMVAKIRRKSSCLLTSSRKGGWRKSSSYLQLILKLEQWNTPVNKKRHVDLGQNHADISRMHTQWWFMTKNASVNSNSCSLWPWIRTSGWMPTWIKIHLILSH